VIDYAKEDFTRNGEVYDLVFDAVNTVSVSRTLKSLTKNGTMILSAGGMTEMLQGLWISMTSSKTVMTGVISHTAADIIFLKELIESGKFKPVIDRTYPLEEIAEAHAYAETGRKKGNIIITI
jgi:NADPH:quinone reductase-like Zn-dependent oxidoreductase